MSSLSQSEFLSRSRRTRLCPFCQGRADSRRCGNHRWTQVSNVIPSVMLDVIRERVETQIENFLLDVLMWLARRRNIICNALRTSMCAAGTGTKCVYTVRRPREAYDTIGCCCTENDLADKLKTLGLDGEDLDWRLDALRNDGYYSKQGRRFDWSTSWNE